MSRRSYGGRQLERPGKNRLSEAARSRIKYHPLRRQFWIERLEDRYVLSANPLNLPSVTDLELHLQTGTILTSLPANPELLSGTQASANLMPTSPFPLSETFSLHSLPGATKTIYLDFDGHVTQNTPWNTDSSLPTIVTPEFSLDGDRGTFSPTERLLIQGIWERVAEDFRPFEVNVTTQDPGVDALRNLGDDDDEWGIRVVIGGDSTFDWFTPTTGREVGGVAYVGSFSDSIDNPTFVFGGDAVSILQGNLFAIEFYLANTISHEVGHTLGLRHDGQYRFYYDLEEEEWVRVHIEYYPGHGEGLTSWAPIMGGASAHLTQWSQGDYFNADNIQDDLNVITTQNGFDYRMDDHGDSPFTATALTSDGFTFEADGIIERNTDVDFFTFTVLGLGEAISLDISPFHRGPNLDVFAKLYHQSNLTTPFATSNPEFHIYAGSQTILEPDGGWRVQRNASGQLTFNPNPDGAWESIDVLMLPAGTYYLSVEGTGRPIAFIDPIAHPGPIDPPGPNDPDVPDDSDWGYSDYGSLGYYSISGTRKSLVVGVDFDSFDSASPTNWTTFFGGGPQTILGNTPQNRLISELGSIVPYVLTISTTGAAVETFGSSLIAPAYLPNHAQSLDTLSGFISGGGDTWTFEWSNLAPSTVYEVYVFGHADMEARNLITIVGGDLHGQIQVEQFVQDIGSDALLVNREEAPGGEELILLAVHVISDDEGVITISVVNEPGSALGIGGLAIAPTSSGSIHGRKWHDRNGNRVVDFGEEGLEGWTIYLDLNGNGQLDTEVITTEDQEVTQASIDVPQEIKDYTTVKSELFFTEIGEIVDIDVTLNITHTYVADLRIRLESPSGTVILLVENRGGFGQNFTDTIFDDEGPRSITSIGPQDAPFTGRFRPEQPLSTLNGENAHGVWTLYIQDAAGDDEGVLNSWSISVEMRGVTITNFLEPLTVTDAFGNYSFQNLPPGQYIVREVLQEGWVQTLAPPPVLLASRAQVTGIDFGNREVGIVQEQPGSIRGQKWNDLNGDGIKDANEPGLPGWIVYIDSNNNGVRDIASPTTIASTDVPKPILDFQTTASSVEFSGLHTVTQVEVTLNITHTFVGDLEAWLISPAGTQVLLFSRVGGQFNNFQNLTLADDAERSITTLSFDDWPYTGRWQPEGFLSSFFGETAAGQWTLLVRDSAFADQGTLDSWSITITAGELYRVTDENGFYEFLNLPPGEYVVREEQQPGWVQVAPAMAEIPGALWEIEQGQWRVTIVGIDPGGDDSSRNVRNVDFGNRIAAPLLAGDYNRDSIVDAADYVLWRKTLGTPVTPSFGGADGDGSGVVDENDYGVWRANFGRTLSSGSGSSASASGLGLDELVGDGPVVSHGELGVLAVKPLPQTVAEPLVAELAAEKAMVIGSADESAARIEKRQNDAGPAILNHSVLASVVSSGIESGLLAAARRGEQITWQPAVSELALATDAAIIAWLSESDHAKRVADTRQSAAVWKDAEELLPPDDEYGHADLDALFDLVGASPRGLAGAI